MDYKNIQVERHEAVAIIRLNDPSSLNALTLEMVDELDAALGAAASTARAIVLTGAGRGFSSGANLGKSLDPFAADYDAGSSLETHINPLMRKIRQLPIPIVSAVNGAAAGVGVALALSGDLIVAAESAFFMEAFCRIGLVPDGGSAFFLFQAAGRARAMEMMLLGERIPAAKALEWGLVNRVVPDAQLQEVALALGVSLAKGPTVSLGMIRRLGWEATRLDFDEMLILEREMQREVGGKADHREGVQAFLEKRPATFTGV